MTTPSDFDPFSDIATTRRWWQTHRTRITAALPLHIRPATYTTAFPECMDTWIAMAESLPPPMAEAYICRPLRIIREALKNAPPNPPAPPLPATTTDPSRRSRDRRTAKTESDR